ncbi:hypothetical protein LFM09_36790 [Lentzea alba]|uniref:hypothetical protein n=1 Tax=Lentzea alba TaxID=2714351 RepID=UPI0039BF829C
MVNVPEPDLEVHWVHTGIRAPYSFSISGLATAEHDRGVAFSAELVHPELGVVGRITNRGCGDDTEFTAHDDTSFGDRELKQFLQQCQQDNEPMFADVLHVLLEEIIYEAETAGIVANALRGNQLPVRSYLPRRAALWGPERGDPLVCRRIVLRQDARERLAAKLSNHPAYGLDDESAYWQMFDGVDWTPLLGRSPLTALENETRIRRAEQLTRELPDPDVYYFAVPFSDDLFLFGKPGRRFMLIGDRSDVIHSDEWCQCTTKRQRTVRFERWRPTGRDESGVIHAAKHCRRLVHID